MHRIPLFALVIAAAISSGARAQPSDDVELARALTRKGLSLYDLARYDEALQALEAAYEKKPVPALLFNIAQCHRQLGHLEQAARLYRSYLRTDPPEASARQARELLAKAEEALAKQTSAVQSPPHGLKDSGPPAPDPKAAGPWGQRPPAPDSAVKNSPLPAPAQHQRWPALAAGGVAAGSLALGVIWALGSRSATNSLTALHKSDPVDPARDAALRDEASSKNSRSKIAYAAAAVAAAAGVALYFTF